MKKIHIASLLSILLSAYQSVYSQSKLAFSFVGGNSFIIDINNVKNISFNYNTFRLNKTDDSFEDFNLATFNSFSIQKPILTSVSNVSHISHQLETYPNPFVEAFKVSFNLEKEEQINIQLLNIQGGLIYSVNQIGKTGINTFDFSNAISLNAGTYYIRVATQNKVSTHKMIKL